MNSVVAFHAVSDVDWFADVIGFLRSKYTLVSIDRLSELYSGSKRFRNACHLSIDDGHRSFRDVIFPVLQKYDAPASLFVSPRMCTTQGNFWFQEITEYDGTELKRLAATLLRLPVRSLSSFSVNSILKAMSLSTIEAVISAYQTAKHPSKRPFQNLTADELRHIDRSGLVAVGAHTLRHPILKNEHDACAEYEIDHSIHELSALLGHDIKYFAYPNGIPGVDFTAREQAYAARGGIQFAFTTESHHLAPSDNAMCIPRIQISDRESLRRIEAKLFFASGWNTAKKLKPSGEYVQRRRLQQLMAAGA